MFDTNVLFSAILSSSGSSSRLLKLASEGKITGFTSPALLGELDEVLQRDYGASQIRRQLRRLMGPPPYEAEGIPRHQDT
ncbi:PIN domain-containing protein [Candidatus Micrarchaeota archaeon]|nr:PIN domain-containing protein [Candidatus Micrarchaeota archaeon]